MFNMLPKDIKKYQYIKIIKRVSVFCILEAMAVFSIIMLKTRVPGLGVRVFIGILLAVIPFILTGIPGKLIDSSWKGVIIGIDITTKTSSYFYGNAVWPRTTNNIVLKIQKENGKTIEHTVKSLSVKERKWIDPYPTGDIKAFTDDYHVGDKVVKIYGFDNLLVLSPANEFVHCIVCGSKNPKENECCYNCGHTLLTSDDCTIFK